MSKASKGFRICELQRSRNVFMGFRLLEPWEPSLELVVKKIYADLTLVMNKLHKSTPWIGLTE